MTAELVYKFVERTTYKTAICKLDEDPNLEAGTELLWTFTDAPLYVEEYEYDIEKNKKIYTVNFRGLAPKEIGDLLRQSIQWTIKTPNQSS